MRNKREETPTTVLTAKPGAPVTKKKKSLDHSKRFNNGKNSSFIFWQRAIQYKLTVDDYKAPTAGEQVDYIINHCEGKAAAYLEADLRKRIFDGNLEGLIRFLKDLFNNLHRRDRALQQFQQLTIRDGKKYSDFYLRFRKLAADAELPENLIKVKLNQKITPELQFRAAAKIARPGGVTG